MRACVCVCMCVYVCVCVCVYVCVDVGEAGKRNHARYAAKKVVPCIFISRRSQEAARIKGRGGVS